MLSTPWRERSCLAHAGDGRMGSTPEGHAEMKQRMSCQWRKGRSKERQCRQRQGKTDANVAIAVESDRCVRKAIIAGSDSQENDNVTLDPRFDADLVSTALSRRRQNPPTPDMLSAEPFKDLSVNSPLTATTSSPPRPPLPPSAPLIQTKSPPLPRADARRGVSNCTEMGCKSCVGGAGDHERE